MRRRSKTVNFGVIYGLSPFGLAGRLGITQAEASAFIDAESVLPDVLRAIMREYFSKVRAKV